MGPGDPRRRRRPAGGGPRRRVRGGGAAAPRAGTPPPPGAARGGVPPEHHPAAPPAAGPAGGPPAAGVRLGAAVWPGPGRGADGSAIHVHSARHAHLTRISLTPQPPMYPSTGPRRAKIPNRRRSPGHRDEASGLKQATICFYARRRSPPDPPTPEPPHRAPTPPSPGVRLSRRAAVRVPAAGPLCRRPGTPVQPFTAHPSTKGERPTTSPRPKPNTPPAPPPPTTNHIPLSHS